MTARRGAATARRTVFLTLAVPTLTLAQQGGASRTAATATAAVSSPTYDAVLEGMNCRQQKSGALDCEYRVGRSLRFVISRVGQEDVVVNFLQVDSLSDYVAGVAPLHGCVMVKPVRANGVAAESLATFAFVSPKSGRVYRNWSQCLGATRGEPVRNQPAPAESTKTKAKTAAPTKPPA